MNKNIIYPKEEVLSAATEYFKGDSLAADVWMKKYCLKDMPGNHYEKTPDDMHRRLAKEFARIEQKYKNPMSEDEIFELLKGFKYIVPAGSPMAGIGNDYQVSSISNCFVIGNDGNSDSYGGIMKIDEEQVQLMKRRGGVGHDLSHIRPEGSFVNNSANTSTGIVPFMERYSNSTREVAQEGRRGALMLSISIKHPDAEKFIDAKLQEGKVTGANISIKLTDEFMDCVLNNKKFIQQYPVDSDKPTFTKEIDAVALWKKIVHNVWRSAEPGIFFWDTIIRESVPDCYSDEGFNSVSTNPCGEIVLCKSDSCRLTSLNLYSYVDNPFTKKASFNFDLFKQHAQKAMRIMDDLVDLELEKIDAIINKIKKDPEPENVKRTERELWIKIKDKTTRGRRTGLGITAEGDMLAAMMLTYGTDKATVFAEEVQKTLKLEAYRSSVKMAKERGGFEVWNADKEKNNPFINRIKTEDEALYNDMMKCGRRNIALLTIAPNGSLSLLTQTTSGVEPVYAVKYMRRRKINPQEKDAKVDFVDKQGDSWQEYPVFHNKFEEYLRINGYDVDAVKKMTSVEIDEIIKKSPYYKATAMDIDWVKKIEMQGRLQKSIDHSLSNTLNLPNDATEDIVAKVYEAGHKNGCKGITAYRDGSRTGVLISDKTTDQVQQITETHAQKRPKALDVDVMFFQNNYEKWIAVIGTMPTGDGTKPYELFTGKHDSFFIPPYVSKGKVVKRRIEKKVDGKMVSESIYDFTYIDKDGETITMPKLSRSFSSEYWNYAKLISALMRHGMPMEYLVGLVDSLNLDDTSLNTWKKGVTRVLRKYIKSGTQLKGFCPNCGAKLVLIEGCEKCEACGEYSKCGG